MTPRSAPVSLPIQVSLDDPEPLYAQIERQLRALIVGGHLAAGTPLPSVRALATDLSCSVITTRRAYQELEQGGFIRTRQGMGTVVADLPTDEVDAFRREPVERAFAAAIRDARETGMDDNELREIFEIALEGKDITP